MKYSCSMYADVLFLTVRLTCLALFCGLADSKLLSSETKTSLMTHPHLVVLWSGTLTIELPFYSPRLTIHPLPHLLLFIREEGRSQRAVRNREALQIGHQSGNRHRLISTQRQFTVLLAVVMHVLGARRHSEGKPHEQRGNMELHTERFNVTGIYFLTAVVSACPTFLWNRQL